MITAYCVTWYVCLLADEHTTLHELQYKFVVDGEWKYAPDQAAMYDEGGNVNNVLEVQEYVPENLDSLSGFDPPPSPPSRSVRQASTGFRRLCQLWLVLYVSGIPRHVLHAEAPGPRLLHRPSTANNPASLRLRCCCTAATHSCCRRRRTTRRSRRRRPRTCS
jgi:Glycogen recognition site of AMP-activated protein kinase